MRKQKFQRAGYSRNSLMMPRFLNCSIGSPNTHVRIHYPFLMQICFKFLSVLFISTDLFQKHNAKQTEIKFGRITACNGNLATITKNKQKKTKPEEKKKYFLKSLPLQLLFSSHSNDHRISSKNQMRSHFLKCFPRQEGIHTPAGYLAASRSVL